MTVALLLGVGFGLGVCLLAAGLAGMSIPDIASRARVGRSSPQLAAAVAGALVAFTMTRWPVALAGGAAAGWALPQMVSGRRQRQVALERTRAVAAFTEMLRDTTAAGLGLAEAVRAAGRVAPPALAAELATLERRAAREPLPEALRAFAVDVADPLCDLVVSSLLLAERRSGSLDGVLSSLAATAREEAALRSRVESGRAGLAASAAVVTATTVAMVTFFCLVRSSYLSPYGSLLGQAVLCLVGAAFVGSFVWFGRLRRADDGPRLLAGEVTR